MGNTEKNFKRWIKNKNRIGFTLGMFVSFLITGGIVYSQDSVNNGEIILESESNPIGLFSTDEGNSSINNGTITGIGSGLTGINVNNGAKAINSQTAKIELEVSEQPLEMRSNQGINANNSAVENYGNITIKGAHSQDVSDSGIMGYNSSNILNAETGEINISGNAATGVTLGLKSSLVNNGNIETSGFGSLGLEIFSESSAYNKGNIVTNGVSGIGVLVMDKSAFLNEGYIEVNGDAYSNSNINSGIDVQSTATAINNGTIKTTGKKSFGMRSNGIIVNGENGEIITTGFSGIGMYSRKDTDSDEALALNYGLISTEGENASGMKSDSKGVIINYETGVIETTGENARGLVSFRGNRAENYGKIITTGAKGRGIHLNGEETIGINHKTGVIKTLGEKAYGMRSYNGATLENYGTIITGDKNDSTKGDKAFGMHAFRNFYLGEVESDNSVLENIIYDYNEDTATKNAKILNEGKIETYGDFTHGMSIVAGNNAVNHGEITTSGKEASGIFIRYSGESENFGKVETSGLEAKGVKVISNTYSVDDVEYVVNDEERYKSLISKNSAPTIFTNHKDAKIITKGDKAYGVYLESFVADEWTRKRAEELGVTLTELEVKKAKFTNNGIIDTSGDMAYGIYTSNSIVDNNGDINTKGKGAYGIYAINNSEVNHNGKIHVNDPNAYGIVYDSTSKINISKNAVIKVNGKGSNAIMMLENLNRNSLSLKSTINNYGQIEVEGSESKGIIVNGAGTAINSGYIDINADNSIGMYASGNGSIIDNKGTIALNLDDNSTAMVGELGAIVKNNGMLKLKDYKDDSLSDSKLNELLKVDSKSTLINSGVVINANDQIVISSGEEIFDKVENIEKDEIFKGQNTVVITGEKLEGILNQGENFIEENGKYLLKIPSSNDKLTISGTINAGKNGIEIIEGAKVNLSGNINALENAILVSGAELNSNGANIVGNVLLENSNKVAFSKTQLDGDILGSSESNVDISLMDSTTIKGDILLNSGEDKLTIDSSTGNLLQESMIIDGGAGNDNLTLGSTDEITVVKANIKNFENNNFLGKVFLDSKAKILSENINEKLNQTSQNVGDITIGTGSYLVLGVSSNGEHSLDSISGNVINADEDGKLIIQSDLLSLNEDGKYQLDMVGTQLNLENENILASQFIYEVNKTTSGNLELSMKTLGDIGIDEKYQDIYESILSSGNLNGLNSTLLGNEQELESLLNQISYKNPYASSIKNSKASLVAWNEGIKSLKKMPQKDKWLVTGKAVGNYYDSNNTTGLLAIGEYGISSKLSLGIAFGGGKQTDELKNSSSKLESDTFYVGAIAKKDVEKYRFLGTIGYQKNSFDSTRILSNNVDNFRFSENYNTNALNILLQGVYKEKISEKMSIEPKISFNYNYISQDGINEGNKAMGMNLDKTDLNLFESSLGIDFVRELNEYNGYKGQVYLGMEYSHLGGDTDKDLSGAIGSGNKFKVKAAKMNENIGVFTLGTDITNSKGYNYGVKLNYEVGNENNGSQVIVSLGYEF